MEEEKKVVPVTEGTITIQIAEYRGLIEAVAAAEARCKMLDQKNTDYFVRTNGAENALKDKEKIIEGLEAKVKELGERGCELLDFIESDANRKEVFKQWIKTQKRHAEKAVKKEEQA